MVSNNSNLPLNFSGSADDSSYDLSDEDGTSTRSCNCIFHGMGEKCCSGRTKTHRETLTAEALVRECGTVMWQFLMATKVSFESMEYPSP